MSGDPTGIRGTDIGVKRPPLVVVLIAIAMVALGETSGALLSQFRPSTQAWVRARVAANPQAHGLAGSAEYDAEVVSQTVFATEAGLSFLHTHAEGLGLVVFFAGTLVASVVSGRRARALLQALLAAGGLFPLGYLVYALAVPVRGRDAGIALAETWVLTPLGSAAILGLLGLLAALVAARRHGR